MPPSGAVPSSLASRSKRLAVLGLALAPLVFFAALIGAQPVSGEALAQSVQLDGAWKVLPGEEVGGEAVATPDADAAEFHVPGGFQQQGFHGSTAWLRRHFVATEALVRQPLYFMLSDTRSGAARVFINGHFIGQTREMPDEHKVELSGTDGWRVPPGVVSPGENVVAIHLKWAIPGGDGIMHEQVLLGPASLLEHHNAVRADQRRRLYSGAAGLMVFLLVLFASLLAAAWRTPNRPLYLSCIAFLAAATSYLQARTHILFNFSSTGLPAAACLFLSIVACIYALPEFISRYLIGPRSRFRRFNGWVCLGFFVALIGALFSGRGLMGVVAALSAYGLVPIVFLSGLSLTRIFRRQSGLDPILCSGIFCAGMAGALDTLHDLGVWPVFGMFSLGISACAIMAAVVLIADFTKVSFDNQALSVSLSHSNAELAEALEKAQEAARLKSEFVASVSHELRTPLNSVLNIPEGLLHQFRELRGARCERCEARFELEPGEQLSVLTRCQSCGAAGVLVPLQYTAFEGDGEGAVRGLKQIHRAGNHLLALIDDVLDFSKLEAGRMRLSLEHLGVSTVAKQVLETLEALSTPRRIRLRLEAPMPDVEIKADRVKLAQILINLVGNAVKFSPDGAEVLVEVEATEKGAKISVVDQGIGIAEEHHETIFESFRQVDGSNTRRFGGTGLGLAITRRLVEAHGGTIGLKSSPSLGSTFFVELPREGGSGPTQLDAGASTAEGRGKTVLILDDERMAVENLKLAIRPLGHRVEGIQDPRSLDEALERVRPDLLILDVMMPEISGLEVVRALKARQSTLPILVSSAYPANVDIVRALGAAWLAKPWRSEELQAEVTRLLRREKRVDS